MEKNEIFISYSRRNSDFTKKLFAALEADNRSVWADWDDIAAAAEWRKEIQEGIEKAEVILFVLSPEWIKSEECKKEMDHAVKNGKKLITILCDEKTNYKDLPEDLTKINWIDMSSDEKFKKELEKLSKAIDTDLEWRKRHTRFQVRAIEWDKKVRDNSFVLRGKDLADSEDFLSQSTGKDPQPTDLQKEFFRASRKDAKRRQRLTMAGVLTALVVSVVLGIIALFQWVEAEDAKDAAVVERDRAIMAEETAIAERDRADLNAEMAFARELAAKSVNNLIAQPERSLLLALEAVNIVQSYDQPIQPQIEDALRRAVQTSRVRTTISGHDGAVLDVAFSPDGQQVASAGEDGYVYIWDIANQDSGFYGEEPLDTLPQFDTEVTSVAFSPDGSQLLVAGIYEVIIWDLNAGEVQSVLDDHLGAINEAIYTPNGERVVTASADGTAKVWDALTGDLLFDLVGHTDEVYSVAVSTDGMYIATAGPDSPVIIWDANSGTQLQSVAGDGCQISDVAFNFEADTVITGDNCIRLAVWDLASGEIIFTNDEHTDIYTDVAYSPDGTLIASASMDDTVLVIDALNNQTKYTLIDTSDILTMAFSPDGMYIVTGNTNGEIKLWDANPISSYEIMGFQPHYARIDGMEFSPDGKHFVTSSWDTSAYIWSLTGEEKPIDLFGHMDMVRDVAYSPDGKSILTGGYDGTALIWDAATGKIIHTLSGNLQNVMAVNFSPDGKLAVGGLDNNMVLIWDANTGQQIKTLQSEDHYFITEVTFSPDGNLLVVASDTGTVVWDATNWTQKFTLIGHTDWVKGVDFSPDGSEIVTGSYDTDAIVWDANSGEILLILSGHSQGINDVVFSPDGTLIATASVDRSAKLWDSETGELVATLYTPSDKIASVAFSPDGNLLATASETGVVRIYYTHFNAVLALAETRITRSLTDPECGIYLYEYPCPETLYTTSLDGAGQ